MTASVTATAHQVSTKALGWLHEHHRRGALPEGTGTDVSDPPGVYKAIGELALAASLVVRESVSGATGLRQARDMMDHAWGQFGEGDLLYARLLRYPLMTDSLETYAHLARGGYRHEPMQQLLRQITGLRSVRSVEHHPNRALAVANAARVTGLEGTGRAGDWEELIRATWLGNTPEPWLIDWLTGYSMTHTVFHVTDWGRRPEDLPDDIGDYLAAWLPAWIDIWAEVGEWDLLGELMIVGSCLKEPYLDPGAWELMAGIQHEDGLVPRDASAVSDDPDDRFADQQHTAVVAAIAGTLAVSRTLDGGSGGGSGGGSPDADGSPVQP
ncbi:DUF6895 family protein [Streptomyces sp. RKAG337]|uniref:DUF6895 family protein n=1 Tax=Streptomyces sp. RKAG337 TaxID=2893404 RepID=UPI00203462A7|nr:hypothetical protein [Streptomyces sp. RKAG337]MCM2426806.1 hypothetical protein [Streptomyces sp. RKAG337]